ncbi:peptidylprolyl isomerase [Stutzerimonas kirkiae]|uniref:Periplasmic chaperone PpiD n=1 Tax=Stutzerimonas kirkiae TaxID=2211392 RepID=A0A4Q9R9L5_9GAMM|nr:SurA N-terminal domain-containing protein [Stutzerimonas kirkiae]TBU97225.1 peptidylprolyl isomerase [Stutzerimonas kirkiae]TBV03647.1 peptidylprolyl isomerase [Stutzerimonas kirkiae]
MLQNIRDNSQGWIAKTIIGIIVVLLALTGVEAIFNSTGNSRDVAEVNGEKISQAELEQAVNMQRRQLVQQFGRDFDASLLDDRLLRESALAGLIERQVLLQSTVDAGFAFSQAALDQLILQTPEFQVDGVFNAARFDQVIQQMGYNRLQFRHLLEQELLIGQLRAGISGTSFVTDRQVADFARLEQQTRDFASITVKANPDEVQVSDDDIAAYYNANTERFRSPEQVVVEYLELRKESFFDQVEASEEELQELYQKQIANLAEQRRAAHILIEVGGDHSEAQAKARIDEIAARLNAGEDFAVLAKEFSEDSGSAVDGGDLGFAGKGVYDPAFEEALYALQENQVSAPVESEFGWHLIKLLGVQSPVVPDFDSLRPELEREVKARQVEQRFVEAGKQLEDSAFEAADLAQPGQELGLNVNTTPAFGREGGEGITSNRQVLQAAFSEEVLVDGANSGIIELDPDTSIVLRAKEHLQPETLPLEKVRDTIALQLRQEKAAEKASSEGKLLLAQAKSGEIKGQWSVVEAATRAQDSVAPALLQAVFRMPKPTDVPSYTGLTLVNGDYVVLRLDGVSEPEEALSDEDKLSYRRFLASRAGQLDFAAYRDYQQGKAKIEKL